MASIIGEGVDTPELSPVVATCARKSANEVGIGLLLNAPKENLDFFEKLLNVCVARQLRAQNIPTTRVQIASTNLASDTKCDLQK
jgi:hypothetical protein